MKKINILGITTCICAILVSGCTSDFDEMNRNPNQVSEVTPALLLPPMQRNSTYAQADMYERACMLYAMRYSQYCGEFQSGWASDRYVYNDDWASGNLWTPFYVTVRRNYLDIKDLGAKYPEYEAMWHIARVVHAIGAIHTTDVYGDIPYSDASTGSDKPKYDAQKDIYYDVLKELAEAAAGLSQAFSVPQQNYGTSDMFYGGDIRKWIKLANSLRLRYALRLSFIDPDKAKAEGEAALKGTLMETVADKAYTVPSKSSSGCPMLANWWDGAMSATFERIYKTSSTVVDPRMEMRWGYAKKPAVNRNEYVFIGVPNGLPAEQAAAYADSVSLPWGYLWTDVNDTHDYGAIDYNAEKDFDIMLYSEVCFLKAEAALRGWAGAGDVQTNYENGIRASFDESRKGVSPAYINTANDETYITTGNVRWDEAADFEAKLERIITQKWIALFPDGHEAWAEFRRTGYPRLTPVVRSDDPDINAAAGEFIKKLRYCDVERDSNAENAKSSALNGGRGDGQNVRVWWDTGRYK